MKENCKTITRKIAMKHLAIKVTNKYESKTVQKALFDMGFKWGSGSKELQNLEEKLIPYYIRAFIKENDLITNSLYASNMSLDEVADNCKMVSSSDFFSTYAGHVELFPDYIKEKQIDKLPLNDFLNADTIIEKINEIIDFVNKGK